jgi:hypothetical protein
LGLAGREAGREVAMKIANAEAEVHLEVRLQVSGTVIPPDPEGDWEVDAFHTAGLRASVPVKLGGGTFGTRDVNLMDGVKMTDDVRQLLENIAAICGDEADANLIEAAKQS